MAVSWGADPTIQGACVTSFPVEVEEGGSSRGRGGRPTTGIKEAASPTTTAPVSGGRWTWVTAQLDTPDVP